MDLILVILIILLLFGGGWGAYSWRSGGEYGAPSILFLILLIALILYLVRGYP